MSLQPPRSRRHRQTLNRAARHSLEGLEARRMLCMLPHAHAEVTELRPDLVGVESAADGGAPAVINWVNRGQASDRFAAVFGANAGTARSVVDRVIIDYMQMIESFNYADGSNVYNLTVSMDTATGNGGAANLNTTLGGKPKSGSLTLQSGDDGAGSDWFLDPDAALNFNSAEFLGNIENPFAGDAPSGSPALNRADLYTVVAAEVAHCLGLFGGTGVVPLWDARTTNTGVADDAEGGGNSTFWTFTGPSIRHLMTGFNAGTPNSFNGAVHSSGGTANITFGGFNWRGNEDAGNARFEESRRYLIPDTLGLMFRDAYGYSVAPANTRDTFHSVLNRQTGELLIRGGFETLSDDDISITLSGGTIVVSVNVGNDVPGSGALPGAGNLPAYVTSYNIGDVDSIRIEGRDGADDILVAALPANMPLAIDAGTGDDTIRIGDVSNTLNGIDSNITISAGTGTDHVLLDDSTADAFSDIYAFDVVAAQTTFDRGAFPLVSMSAIESMELLASGSGFEEFNVNRLSLAVDLEISAGGGDSDTLNLAPTLHDLAAIAGDVVFRGDGGVGDTVNLFDATLATASTFTLVNGGINHVLDRATFGSLSFGATTEAVNLTTGAGANTFNVAELNSNTALTINAGGGNDALTLGTAGQSLNGIAGNVVFNGDAGTDAVTMHDQGNATSSLYVITSDTVDRPTFGSLNFETTESLTLNGGAAGSPYDIDPVGVGLAVDLTINAGPAADVFSVTPTARSMQLTINADITINAGTGAGDELFCFDSNSSVSFPYAIDADSVTRGASPINYTGLELIDIDGASGSNAFAVSAATAALVLAGNDGNDSLTVGGTAQNLDNIDGNISFGGGLGTDTIEMRDQQNAAAATYTITDLTFDRTGFSFLAYNGTESLTVRGGSAGTPFLVRSLASATDLELFGAGGNDTFTLGTATNNLEPLDGAVTVHGEADTDVINVNDQAETFALGFTVTATSVTRTGFGGLTYDTAEALNVNAGNAAGSIGKLHNVESTAAGVTTTLNAGSGDDNIRLSNTALRVSNLAGNVVVTGQGGNDTLTAMDQANLDDDVYSVGPTSFSTDNSAAINYATVESFVLNAGAGDNDINLTGSLATTPLTIFAGAGGDSINLNNLGGFAGAVNAVGQGGTDVVFVNDQTPGPSAYTLTSSSLARTGFAGLTYSTAEAMTLLAQDGGNTITVNSTVGPTTIDANDGTDTINVLSAGSQAEVTLAPSGGNDVVNVNTDNAGTAAVIVNASHTLGALNVGAGGFFFSGANGGHVIRTASLDVNAAGRFDLADNTLLIDYAGASPLATVRARLTSGYNNGAWSGAGINSSRAAATPGRALGYAEASALFSAFPVTFAGQSIDNTTLIVRYTRYGDANLDRAVNLQDFNRLAGSFGTGTLWSQGNFNYDAGVNLADFNLLAGNFGQAGGGEDARLPGLPGGPADEV